MGEKIQGQSPEGDDRAPRSFSSELLESLRESHFAAVTNLIHQLHPSYADGVADESIDPNAAGNILALCSRLTGADLEHTLRTVTCEYESIPSVTAIRESFARMIADFPEQQEASLLGEKLLAEYINIYIYHNAEHMLTMASDCLRIGADLAEELGLDPKQRERLLKRLTISAMYHDVGNGRYPRDGAGHDELDAVRKFLQDVQTASTEPQLSYLADLSHEEVIQIAASIMATVFRDRYADDPILKDSEYMAETLAALSAHGFHCERDDFVNKMLSDESVIIRNADVASSLRVGNLVKNSFTVFYENLLKSRVFIGKSFTDCRSVFIALLCGKFQEAIHGKSTTWSIEAQSGNLLINPNNRFNSLQAANDQVDQSERELQLTIAYDGPICEAMCREIEDNLLNGDGTILSWPLEQLGKKLRNRVGEQAYVPYHPLFEDKYSTRSFIGLTQEEVNEIFQLHTLEAQRVLDGAKQDPREAVRELARAHAKTLPDSWQGRYILETLRYAREDETRAVVTIDTVSAGSVLVRDAEKSTHAYIVLEGDGVLHAVNSGTVVNTISAVNVAGEISVLTGQRTADLVVANGSVRLATIDGSAVAAIVDRSELQSMLIDGTNQRLANGEIITATTEKNVEEFLLKVFDYNWAPQDNLYSREYLEVLQSEELQALARAQGWKIQNSPAGTPLIFEGSVPEYVYVLTQGCVEIQIEPKIYRKRGEIIGEASLLTPNNAATANVCAGEDAVSAICLPRDLLAKCPRAVAYLAKKRGIELK